jgi:hypothetical protein
LSNDRPTKRSSQHLEKLAAGLPPAACHICADPAPPSSSCLHPSTYPHSAEAPLTEDLEFRRLWTSFSRWRAATTLHAAARLHSLLLTRRRSRPVATLASYQWRRPLCLLMRGTKQRHPRAASPAHEKRAVRSASFHSLRRNRRAPTGRGDASDWGGERRQGLEEERLIPI